MFTCSVTESNAANSAADSSASPRMRRGRSAGGKIKTGIHVDGAASPGTRVGYTAMKILGLDIPSWGTLSNTTSKDVGEILV